MENLRYWWKRILVGEERASGPRDVTMQPGHSGVDDIKERAEDMGLGDLDLDMLASLEFPLEKAEIISQLKAANANETLINLVENVPDQVYGTLDELKSFLPT